MPVKSKLKYIQSLGHKKQRDADGVFLAEGSKIVSELLANRDTTIVQVYALEEWIAENEDLLRKDIEVITLSEQELKKISQLSTPNQVVAMVKQNRDEGVFAANGIILALDTIQDPGNMGTIIRIADWYGVAGIVCSQECADMYNSKVVQASMASIARVKMLYTDLPQWIGSQSKRVYGALLEGKAVEQMDKPENGIIVIGNESKGISDSVKKLVNVKITISKKGEAESLNAAVATGIILSHLV